MNVYCACPAMSKNPKTTDKLSKKRKTNVILIVFDGALCEVCAYTVTVCQHESSTRKSIS